jgi:hypothetical protein
MVLHPIPGLALGGDWYGSFSAPAHAENGRHEVEGGYERGPLRLRAEQIGAYDGRLERRLCPPVLLGRSEHDICEQSDGLAPPPCGSVTRPQPPAFAPTDSAFPDRLFAITRYWHGVARVAPSRP